MLRGSLSGVGCVPCIVLHGARFTAKFVSVLVFRLDPQDLPGVAREVQLAAERKGPLLNGFIESVVMANDEKNATQTGVGSGAMGPRYWPRGNRCC